MPSIKKPCSSTVISVGPFPVSVGRVPLCCIVLDGFKKLVSIVYM